MARLGCNDWVDAAYATFEAAGLAAVRVEVVAKSLGATKGSFYWHFRDRRALVDAVLARWEKQETDSIIDAVERHTEPALRLEALFSAIADRATRRTVEGGLYSDAASAGVSEFVDRVTERRVSHVAALLQDVGFSKAAARLRAVVIVSAAIGYQQLTIGDWEPGGDPRVLVNLLLELVGPLAVRD